MPACLLADRCSSHLQKKSFRRLYKDDSYSAATVLLQYSDCTALHLLRYVLFVIVGGAVGVGKDLEIVVVEDDLVFGVVQAVAGVRDVGPHLGLGDFGTHVNKLVVVASD